MAQHHRPFSLSCFTSMSFPLRLCLLCLHLLIQLIHHHLGTVTGEISASSCIDCGIADVLFLCRNSTFIFPGKIDPVADQRSENESYMEQIYTLTMWFSTTNELCNQYLLQNDKLKQHRCLFPVKQSAQSASVHGCGLVSKCMHVFISPRCNSYISLLEYAAYVFSPPPSSIVYYNNTVKGTGGGRLQMRYQSHQINQMGRISGEEGVWCKFPSVWKRCLPHLTRLIMKLSVTSINSPRLVSSHPPQRFCVRRVDDTAVTPWQKVGVVSTHWSH